LPEIIAGVCVLGFNFGTQLIGKQEFKIKDPLGYTISMLTVGIFEELIFRVYLLNTILTKRYNPDDSEANKKKNVIYALVLSSAIFGAIHMMNILEEKQHPEQ
jgi:membrane protease YdiL (CAAX protease family)